MASTPQTGKDSTMTTSLISDDVRTKMLAEAGSEDVVRRAIDDWAAGRRREALEGMWNDGADREWLYHFVIAVDAGDTASEALIDEVTR